MNEIYKILRRDQLHDLAECLTLQRNICFYFFV